MDDFEALDAAVRECILAFDAARELMLKQRVKQRELHERLLLDITGAASKGGDIMEQRELHERLLRDITGAASKGGDIMGSASKGPLPVQTLHCDCHYGYRYSKEFRRFVQAKQAIPDPLATIGAISDSDPHSVPDSDSHSVSDLLGSHSDSYSGGSHDERVRDAQWIVLFGQHVMEKWPGIAKLVKVYMRNDLGHQMADIQMIASHKEDLRKYMKIRDAIAVEIGRSDKTGRSGGKTECYLYCSMETHDYSVYARSALEAMCTELDAEQTECILAIKNTREALLMRMTEAQYEAMLQSLDTKVAEEATCTKRGYKKINMTFSDAITKYGEHHCAVWEHQEFFDKKAMRFLLLHPEYTEQLLSEGDNVDCTQELGLCVASGIRCKLQIGKLLNGVWPNMTDWRELNFSRLKRMFGDVRRGRTTYGTVTRT